MRRLAVQNFRSYTHLTLDLTAACVVLSGANGTGKTNILEAISLLAPGRGLRQAWPSNWRHYQTSEAWGVALTLEDDTRFITGSPRDNPLSNRRTISMNGTAISNQGYLADYTNVLWLTPQMDGLFMGDAVSRRKFFDRLVYHVHPEHAVRLQRYELALRQRNKLLKDKAHPSLIRSLHPILVAEGVAIAAARLEILEPLNQALQHTPKGFPVPHLHWHGAIEEALRTQSAAQLEQAYHDTLDSTLEHDRMIGQTRHGIHRSDVTTVYQAKNMPAENCSTGEQKALLISLVLAHARWISTLNPQRPLILLLDDIAAHLDEKRRQSVFDWITHLRAQTWLTGTERSIFSTLAETAHILELPLP